MRLLNITTEEKHIRSQYVNLNRHQLRDIILAGLRQQGMDFKTNEAAVTIDFSDETEGSPPYKVGTRARVSIVEDLMPKAEEGKSR